MRRTDMQPEEGTPAAEGIVRVLVLAILLAGLGFALSLHAQPASSASVAFVRHDPDLGTRRYTAALDRIQYAGGMPEQWTITTPDGETTGTIDQLDYRKDAPGHWRADVEFQAWIRTRVFAAGFER